MLRQIIFLLVLIFLLSGCAVLPKNQQFTVDGIMFHNTTSSMIGNVRLRVDKIQGFATCSNIPPQSSCSTTFPIREYQGNPVMISWNQNEKLWETPEIVVNPPKEASPGKPLFCIVEIGNQGSLNVYFRQ